MKGAYGASKSGLAHLIKTLSQEGQRINLSANAISPYIIDTPANRSWMQEADFNRWIKPEEIGEVANSLFENFKYVSGNVITMKERF
jgi:NAD(P)-dependent dehydrogenase (short-subunit alcohol dehydrogenase family)